MKLFWGILVSAFFLIGVLSYFSRVSAGYIVCWILVLFFVTFTLALTPKKLIVYKDKLEIKLWLGYTVTILANNIKAVKKLPKSSVFLSQDVPFKSSWSIPVHIIQKKGLAFVVTPLNPDKFVAQVSKIITTGGPDSSGQPAQVK